MQSTKEINWNRSERKIRIYERKKFDSTGGRQIDYQRKTSSLPVEKWIRPEQGKECTKGRKCSLPEGKK